MRDRQELMKVAVSLTRSQVATLHHIEAERIAEGRKLEETTKSFVLREALNFYLSRRGKGWHYE